MNKRLNLISFNYSGYGGFACSKCNTSIYKCFVVCEPHDIDGNNWRMFCLDCWSTIRHMSLSDIYSQYSMSKSLLK